jgi:hypothetical protein
MVMQQLAISTHKEAPLKFNFPVCIPVPNKAVRRAHISPTPICGLVHCTSSARTADRMAICQMTRMCAIPAGLPEKAGSRYYAAND